MRDNHPIDETFQENSGPLVNGEWNLIKREADLECRRVLMQTVANGVCPSGGGQAGSRAWKPGRRDGSSMNICVKGDHHLRIVDVRTRILRAEAPTPFRLSIGRYTAYTAVIVEIHTDEGIVGVGEAIARRGPEMAQAAVESLLRPVLMGQDPAHIEGLWTLMVEQLRRWGHTKGVVVEAISGVDTALWDLAGKVAGRPVHAILYGTGRSHVPCYASSIPLDTADNMARRAESLAKAGFLAIKVKIGRTPEDGGMRADLEALAAVRQATPRAVDVMVDANGAYDAGTALRIAREMESLDIAWFEEPLPPDDIEGYKRLHAGTTIPLAAGETEFTLFGFAKWIGDRLIDVVQPDVARCGGITGVRHVYTLAYAHNIQFAPHTGLSAGISMIAALQAAAAAPRLYAYEYMVIDNPLRDIFRAPFPKPHAGTIDIPSGPGLGLEIDQAVLKHFEAESG